MINGAGKPSGTPSGESRPSGPDLDSDEANTFLSDEDEHGDDILCRNGKRKRPVSVSWCSCSRLRPVLGPTPTPTPAPPGHPAPSPYSSLHYPAPPLIAYWRVILVSRFFVAAFIIVVAGVTVLKPPHTISLPSSTMSPSEASSYPPSPHSPSEAAEPEFEPEPEPELELEINTKPEPNRQLSLPIIHNISASQSQTNSATPRCELCKQRKVKCDRGQPACGWCTRNGAICEYRERKKPGLRAGYGRELEQRLDKLEEILRSHSEILQVSLTTNSHPGLTASIRNSNPSLPSDQGSTPRDAPTSLFRASEPIRTPQADTALFLHKSAGANFPGGSQNIEFGVPHTPSINDGYHGQGPLSAMSAPPHMAPMQPSAAAQDYYGSSHSPTAPMSSAPGTTTPDREMPPYDLLYALVDLYFKHINTWCPILHRKTTLDSLFGPSTLDETDRVLLHAIVATTMRYSTDARLTEERREHYHKVSKERVLLYGMGNSSVKSLQALVILALDLCGSSNGPPGWNIMALITRSVVQLGLAVETTSSTVSPHYMSIYTLRAITLSEPKDFIEEEARRRLFWMIYLLDRYATIATAFEFALDDKEIDRTLPCRDDLWIKNQKVETRWFRTEGHHDESSEHEPDRPENLGAFAHYIEILGILSKVHKFLKQPVDISALSDVEQWQMRYKELDNMLTSWKFGLPGEFGNMAKLFQPGSKNINCAWVMLHATYHTAVIRLHSSAAYPTTRSPIFTPSYSASQRCHSAVENVAALGEFVVNNGMLEKLGPPFAFTLWVSARLLLVHGSTVEHKLSPQISFFVESLREMGRFWPVAARYSQLLQRVLDEHRDSERQGDGVTPSSIKILSDMRRTAFDLDFLISRQPRHGGSALSRLPSVTPARTPAPNELEYLDVFDFFNVPRLPVGGENISGANHAQAPPGSDMEMTNGSSTELAVPNEFNITNFMVDANSDWLFKQEGSSKFMAAN